MQLVGLDKMTASERAYWSHRSTQWGDPMPPSLDYWILEDREWEKWEMKAPSIFKLWRFMEPFFASRGYMLFREHPDPAMLYCTVPHPSSKPASEMHYPYGRRMYKDEAGAIFWCNSPLSVWAARDAKGRDVVIKVVSDDKISDELKVLQRLNAPAARKDPRNHTIHALEFLQFDKFIFVVMPRWDSGLDFEFKTFQELLKYAESYLEVFDFLHDHRVVHADFLEQNTGVNIVTRPAMGGALEGVRDPAACRYTLLDFGGSFIYPYDTDISSAQESTQRNFEMRRCEHPPIPYNPFAADVLFLGWVLQRWVRHIENIIPAIGPLFDKMMNPDPARRSTAKQALSEFRAIYCKLSEVQLNRYVETLWWESGLVTTKAAVEEKARQRRARRAQIKAETSVV